MQTPHCLTDPGYIAELRAAGDDRSVAALRRLPSYSPEAQARRRRHVAGALERARAALRDG
jgi:hypothetical protein